MEEFLYCPNAMTAWVPGSVEIILDYSNCDNLAGAWGHPDSFLEADVQKEIYQCVLRIKIFRSKWLRLLGDWSQLQRSQARQ